MSNGSEDVPDLRHPLQSGTFRTIFHRNHSPNSLSYQPSAVESTPRDSRGQIIAASLVTCHGEVNLSAVRLQLRAGTGYCEATNQHTVLLVCVWSMLEEVPCLYTWFPKPRGQADLLSCLSVQCCDDHDGQTMPEGSGVTRELSGVKL
ncbi:hypothetical protein RRG08_021716 [Elysia crispata]|uniref:Uncharacterized protein n=1 Tax=Elysia crispata TaxID=231223 RepID=A0AAE1DP07_9GAST|nr:hypothetical protein RRG08_021716 [Elysia crispata]